MITYREAQHIILSEAGSFGVESVALEDADGRVLAEDVFADRDYPPFNRSAMDGYAIVFEDWKSGIREFEVLETIYAGSTPSKKIESGCAFKIMTGAAVPAPADTVIRREDSLASGTRISFVTDNVKAFQNIARKGEDLEKGHLAIQAHTLCTPAVISTLATLGRPSVKVEALPKVALFTTGNEIKALNAVLSDVEIRNSNYFLLRSLLKAQLVAPAIYQHLPDDPQQIATTIRQALDTDVIIMSGGVSAGDADYVPQVLEQLGVKKLFHKVAIKPGKPIWCGKAENGPMVFALPGNPFSTFVTFTIFVLPFLKKSLGLPPLTQAKGNLNNSKAKKTSFDEFFPIKFVDNAENVQATGLNGSGDIRLGIDADALGIHPAEEDTLPKGHSVQLYKL